MMTTDLNENTSDSDLWQFVKRGDQQAFEALVLRHQSVVCAVAYNTCGDLTLSEDIAQETFWAAWRERTSLKDPERVRAWLCGIARNLGKNARRRTGRPLESAVTLNPTLTLPTDAPGPEEEAVSREEETVLWQTLAQMPESYREPLILYYREQQSVAAVAEALDLSQDVVRQRLSRGAGCCRNEWPTWSRVRWSAAGPVGDSPWRSWRDSPPCPPARRPPWPARVCLGRRDQS